MNLDWTLESNEFSIYPRVNSRIWNVEILMEKDMSQIFTVLFNAALFTNNFDGDDFTIFKSFCSKLACIFFQYFILAIVYFNKSIEDII